MLWRLCLMVVLILGGSGCQSGTSPKPASHEASFSDLWKTYRHCQKSEDPREMKADALRLDQTVETLGDEKDRTLVPDGLHPARSSRAIKPVWPDRQDWPPRCSAIFSTNIRPPDIGIMWTRPITLSKALAAASNSFRSTFFPPSIPDCKLS